MVHNRIMQQGDSGAPFGSDGTLVRQLYCGRQTKIVRYKKDNKGPDLNDNE